MILTDYSALCIASITGAVFREKITLNDNLLRHIILNKYRELNVKLSGQFGELLILCDSRSWRKDYFPHYKANRKKIKENSVIDWDMVFRVMDDMKTILNENFPFYVISVDNCEADDLIAAFAHKADTPICIVSKDKDFYQLQKNPLVKQWDYSSKEFIEINEPDYFRNELIIKGDSGDGVPNILSDDDTFVTEGKRQRPITKKRLQELMVHTKDDFISAPVELRRNWERNKILIDLMNPVACAFDGIENFNQQKLNKKVSQGDTMKYLAENKMVVLLGKMTDFYKQGETKNGSAPLPRNVDAEDSGRKVQDWSLEQFINS